jgi:hypothetical protein
MNLKTLSRQFKRNATNFRGWSTSRKIIVIESDDWGSIRMPSIAAYNDLILKGFVSKQNKYAKYDTLATKDDLTSLFDILLKVKDNKGVNPKITANTIMYNPDFDKIEKSGFSEYFNESFLNTLQSYPSHSNSFKLWKEGMAANLFIPQLHGREHINIARWMEGLQANDPAFVEAFRHRTFVSDRKIANSSESLAAAFNFNNDEEEAFVVNAVKDAHRQFKEVFGFVSKTFIAPNYTWNNSIDEANASMGVKTIQSSVLQNYVMTGGVPNKQIRHYMGQRNSHGQILTIRNCYFEPSLMNYRENAVANCLKDITNAFFWNKPAIIASHRLNFIGALDEKNRIDNLNLLQDLLRLILKKWPDVEFMDSTELCDLMTGSH